jgi:HEAT repeat protein
MNPWQKRIGAGVMLFALALLVLSTVLMRERIVEQWLIWQLDSEKETQRRAAAESLARIGSPRAIRALVSVLEEPIGRESLGDYLGSWITGVVVKIGPRAIEPIEEVLLHHPHQIVRQRAARALRNIGPQALPSLVKAVRGPDDVVRWQAISELGSMGPDAEPAVPLLIEILRREEGRARLATVWALANIGLPARGALPDLERWVEVEDEGLRTAVREAIDKIDGSTRVWPARSRGP